MIGANTTRFAAVFVLCLFAVFGFQTVSNSRAAELSGYPDESAHYVTGLLFRSYAMGGWRKAQPAHFAEAFYLHYPKVAIGHWPPAFYIVQLLWTSLFPPTISSLLWLQAVLLAAISAILFAIVQRRFGIVYAAVACALFLCLQVTQEVGAELMAEPLLTLATLLATVAIARYFATGRLAFLVWFGVFVEIAIHTKGSGIALLAVPLSLVVILRRWDELRKRSFWVVQLAIGAMMLPWQLYTVKMVRNGMEGPISVRLLARQSAAFAAILPDQFGWPLLLLIVSGACLSIASRKFRDPLMTSFGFTTLLIVAFHCVAPNGAEPRRLFMGIPAMLVSAALPASYLLRKRAWGPWAGIAMLIIVAIPVARAVPDFHKTTVGYRSVSDWLLRNAAPNTAVLVSSDVDGEGLLISEVAQLQPEPSLYIVRSSKLFTDCDWMGYDCKPKATNGAAGVQSTLDSIPVSYVVVDRYRDLPSPLSWVRDAIETQPALWALRKTVPATSPQGGRPGEILIYERLGLSPVNRLRLRIDLTRMIGKTIGE